MSRLIQMCKLSASGSTKGFNKLKRLQGHLEGSDVQGTWLTYSHRQTCGSPCQQDGGRRRQFDFFVEDGREGGDGLNDVSLKRFHIQPNWRSVAGRAQFETLTGRRNEAGLRHSSVICSHDACCLIGRLQRDLWRIWRARDSQSTVTLHSFRFGLSSRPEWPAKLTGGC